MPRLWKIDLLQHLKPKSTTLWVIVKIFVSILTLAKLALVLHQPLIIGPLAASCGILFSTPAAIPVARMRNVIMGHLFAVIIGIGFARVVNFDLWSVGIAAAIVVLLMIWTNNMHPPACATTVVAVVEHAEYTFIFHVAAAVLTLVGLCLIFNYLSSFIVTAQGEDVKV